MDRQHSPHGTEPGGLSRRELLKRAAGVGLGLGAIGPLGGLLEAAPAFAKGGLDKVRWVSPLGTLNDMGHYPLVVADEMGYFRERNLAVSLLPGTGGTSVVTFVAQHLGDVGGPSPAFLTYAADNGIPVFSIFEWYPTQVFDFAVPADSNITSLKQLEGKTIALHNDADNNIANPILAGAGVDVTKIKYVTFGDVWPQATARHQADAALIWEGLRGQLIGQGLKLKYLLGSKYSTQPSNVFAVRSADLKDAHFREVYKRFLEATVMGFEFGRANPRGTAQMSYNKYPALKALLKPQLALESMMELATGYGYERRRGKGWGYHDTAHWQAYLDVIYRLGQTKKHLHWQEILTNSFVRPANRGADIAKAHRDARAYRLEPAWRKVKLPNYPL
jgi:NitT/TauT family transport system substrate-binding protein